MAVPSRRPLSDDPLDRIKSPLNGPAPAWRTSFISPGPGRLRPPRTRPARKICAKPSGCPTGVLAQDLRVRPVRRNSGRRIELARNPVLRTPSPGDRLRAHVAARRAPTNHLDGRKSITPGFAPDSCSAPTRRAFFRGDLPDCRLLDAVVQQGLLPSTPPGPPLTAYNVRLGKT